MDIIGEILNGMTDQRGEIGSFGEIIFEVYECGDFDLMSYKKNIVHEEKSPTNARRVFTFGNYTRRTKARYAKHDIINGESVLEKIGDDVEKISLDIKLVRDLGVEPEVEAERLREYLRGGRAEFLIIGGEVLGNDKFVLVDVAEKAAIFDGAGKTLVSELSVDFESYKEAAADDLQSDVETD